MSTAFVFPGQGAQAPGMGRAFYDSSREARDVFQKANTLIGYDLAALCFEGPQEELTRTDRCQPALLVTGYAAFSALSARGLAKPQAMAGLSLGEITALLAAGALAFKDALMLVQARGEAMAECAERNPGAMLACIGLDFGAAEDVCRESGAYAANFNSPEQVVLSGTAEAITKAEGLAKERGAKRAMRLEVSGAFHSPLMQPAADELKKVLAKIEIHKPSVPVFSNVTAEPVRDGDHIKELLARQIVSSVRWSQSVQAMHKQGIKRFVEFPPGKVLTGLLRRIEKEAEGVVLESPEDFGKLA